MLIFVPRKVEQSLAEGLMITHNEPKSAGLLWMRDRPVAETST
jgi:hypothetical protein